MWPAVYNSQIYNDWQQQEEMHAMKAYTTPVTVPLLPAISGNTEIGLTVRDVALVSWRQPEVPVIEIRINQ